MPYAIQKRGKKWCLIRQNGSVKSCHDTKKKAQAASNLIMGKEHGWKPTRLGKALEGK